MLFPSSSASFLTVLIVSVSALGVSARMTRSEHFMGRRQVNLMPAEIATRSDRNGIVAFERRAMPEEVPSKSGPDGTAIPFKRGDLTDPVQVKRQEINTLPAEAATMSKGGVISAFSNDGTGGTRRAKRQVNTMPAEAAAMSLDGTITAFVGGSAGAGGTRRAKRQEKNAIPAEAATMSKGGVISAFENDGSGGTRKRDAVAGQGEDQVMRKRQVNTMPAEAAAMSVDGTITTFVGGSAGAGGTKRSVVDLL